MPQVLVPLPVCFMSCKRKVSRIYLTVVLWTAAQHCHQEKLKTCPWVPLMTLLSSPGSQHLQVWNLIFLRKKGINSSTILSSLPPTFYARCPVNSENNSQVLSSERATWQDFFWWGGGYLSVHLEMVVSLSCPGCFHLLSVGITSVCHHIWLLLCLEQPLLRESTGRQWVVYNAICGISDGIQLGWVHSPPGIPTVRDRCCLPHPSVVLIKLLLIASPSL